MGSCRTVSLIAQYMLTRKLLESWWLWIAVDIAYVVMYTSQGLYLTAALQPVFIVMCVLGPPRSGTSAIGTRSAELQRLAGARHYALYVLTSDDIPFAQDGTRDGEHIRGWMTMRFRQELARRREPWIEVRGSRSARLAAAVARIGALEDDVKGAA